MKYIRYQDRMTDEEWAVLFGTHIKNLRLQKNLGQEALAEEAGISPGALKNLENGQGATLKTLIKVLRILKRLTWLGTIHRVGETPVARQRASKGNQYKK